MGGLKLSRDSRHGKFRERPSFPAIPAAPIRGGERRDGIPCGAKHLPLLVRVPVLALTSERRNHD